MPRATRSADRRERAAPPRRTAAGAAEPPPTPRPPARQSARRRSPPITTSRAMRLDDGVDCGRRCRTVGRQSPAPASARRRTARRRPRRSGSPRPAAARGDSPPGGARDSSAARSSTIPEMPFSEWKCRNSSSSTPRLIVGAPDRALRARAAVGARPSGARRTRRSSRRGNRKTAVALSSVTDGLSLSRAAGRARRQEIARRRQQHLRGERLGQILGRARRQRGFAARLVTPRRQHDDRDVAVALMTCGGTSDTSTPCISGIFRSRMMRATGPDAICSIASRPLPASTNSAVSSRPQRRPDHLADRGGVVDDQNLLHWRLKIPVVTAAHLTAYCT